MPCYSHDNKPNVWPGRTRAEQQEYNVLTRLACDRCREIEARGGVVPEWAREWWELHKKIDASLASSPRKQREATIRAEALAKLTKEEREELGL